MAPDGEGTNDGDILCPIAAQAAGHRRGGPRGGAGHLHPARDCRTSKAQGSAIYRGPRHIDARHGHCQGFAAAPGAIPRRDRDERPSIIEIDMAGGTTLRVDATVDDGALRRVLAVLRSLS
jgi:hypothetical protein